MIKGLRGMDLRRFGSRLLFCSIVFSLAVGVVMSTSLVCAEEKPYPNRPISLIVGFTPGGASDLAAQIIASKLSIVLGQPVNTVHKPGAGGIIAASWVRKSKPDGYNVLLTVPSMFQPSGATKLDYTHDDFSFLGVFTNVPMFWAVQANSRWKTLKDFVEEAKKYPNKLTYGTTGTNVAGYFVAQLFFKHAQIKVTLVPFKSCGDAMKALLGGHIDSYSCVGAGAILERSLVRTLAIAQERRLEEFADFPTFLEQGYAVTYYSGHALIVPKETPEEITKKLGNALKTATQQYSGDIKKALGNANMWPQYLDGQQSLRYYKEIYKVEREIIESSPSARK